MNLATVSAAELPWEPVIAPLCIHPVVGVIGVLVFGSLLVFVRQSDLFRRVLMFGFGLSVAAALIGIVQITDATAFGASF